MKDALRSADRTRVAVLVVLVFGFALRVAYVYPVHKYPADADCLNAGERALRILGGQLPVFYTPLRIGSFECYMHAAAFSLFGVSRASLGLATLVSGTLLLIVFFALCRPLLGPYGACLALLFLALPSPAYLFWTYMPNGYAETMLFSAAALWTGQHLARRGGDRAAAGFGLSTGFAWWNSLQTLGAILPSAGDAVYRRPEILRRPRAAVAIAAGFAVGALPWIAYNVRHPLATFRNNFAARPATGISQVLSNAAYLATYRVPDLVATVDPNGLSPPNAVQRLLRVPVLILDASALVFAVLGLAAWVRRRKNAVPKEPAPPWMLFIGVAVTVCALAVFSEAGQLRGLTSRYVLPLYLSVAVAQALFVLWIASRSRLAAAAAVAVLLAFNFAGYALPWTASRQLLRRQLASDDALLALLQARRIDAVCGDYWLAYPVNFLSRQRIVGLPIRAETDYYGYIDRLPPGSTRWALIGRTEPELERWVRKLGVPGTLARAGADYFVYLPAESETRAIPGSVFLHRARAAALEPE